VQSEVVAYVRDHAASLPSGACTLLLDVVALAMDLLLLVLQLWGTLEDVGALQEAQRFAPLDIIAHVIETSFTAAQQDTLLHALPARERIRFIAMARPSLLPCLLRAARA